MNKSWMWKQRSYREQAAADGDLGGAGGSAPLNAFEAADAFSSLMDDEPSESETQQEPESPEAAAERLAKQELTGEDDSTKEEGEPAPTPEDITVEIDGKTVKLTKEQIAENYKNGLRQADYTRKTMEAAEVTKAANAAQQQARQERDAYAQKLNNFVTVQDAVQQELAAELTTELAQTDPAEYQLKKHLYDQRHAQLQQAKHEKGLIEQQQQQEHLQAQQAYMAEQRDLLLSKIPEWSDPVKRKDEFNAIWKTAESLGFPLDDIAKVSDHRFVLALREATQYRSLMERAKAAAKKVAALPVKVERSGSPEAAKPDGRTAAMKKLGQTGSISDAANAFSQFI